MPTLKHITPTGAIYTNDTHHLEWVTVGDYGTSNNVKADFLGHFKRIDRVDSSVLSLEEKMVVTLSTQKGCSCNCGFCDVPLLPFWGNNTSQEMMYMLMHSLLDCGVTRTKRLNVHLARMGEPLFNMDEVLCFAESLWVQWTDRRLPIECDKVHPVLSTMMPYNIGESDLLHRLFQWCDIKNTRYDGEAGLQISVQSTDVQQRVEMFDGRSHSLKTVADICSKLPAPKGRKYTLNFAVDNTTIIDAYAMALMFDTAKYVVKLTPIHITKTAMVNSYKTHDWEDIYTRYEEPLLKAGFDVIVFIPSYEEDASRITCGNALLAVQDADYQELVEFLPYIPGKG